MKSSKDKAIRYKVILTTLSQFAGGQFLFVLLLYVLDNHNLGTVSWGKKFIISGIARTTPPPIRAIVQLFSDVEIQAFKKKYYVFYEYNLKTV